MKKGFTLVELLIVIGILAVLSAAVLVVINPAELSRQSRDATRVQDLANMHAALGQYLSDYASADLNGALDNAGCPDHVGAAGEGYAAVDPTTATFDHRPAAAAVVDATREVDGNGWLPVNFSVMSSGSPLPTLPVDPTNTGDLIYRYTCDQTTLQWELNCYVESTKYGSLDANDGGDVATAYEVGSSLDL